MKIYESESAANAAEKIISHLNNLKTELARPGTGDGSADSTICSEMTTHLVLVSLMLTEGGQKYNPTKAMEVTEAITNVNATDLGCSEQDLTLLLGQIDEAKDKASLVVAAETETADSVTEALADLCPASTTPTTASTGVDLYLSKITE